MLIQCSNFLFSAHALKAMIDRDISTKDILEVINHGEIIANYFDDKPYPSFLFLKFVHSEPTHVVLAHNSEDNTCIIITCYHPAATLWDAEFKNKIR